MFKLYIKKASELFGISHTREIYEKAIEVLPDDGARSVEQLINWSDCCYREMSLSYAELETKLGEIDRARAIYSHGSQMSDPRVRYYISTNFWGHIFAKFVKDS